MQEKSKNAKLAKTLKIVIFSRENLYFHRFDVFKFQLKSLKSSQNLHVFGDIDFGCFLEGFWEVKIIDFHVFFYVFLMSFLKSVSDEQKIAQETRDKTQNAQI